MKGLSFSETELKAWMEGRKSITRRLINPQPPMIGNNGGKFVEVVPSLLLNRGELFDFRYSLDNPKAIKVPYLPGETVYISPFSALKKHCPDMIYHKCGTGPGELSDFNCYNDKFEGDTGGYVPCRRSECPRSHALIVSVRPERERNDWVWRYELEKLP